MIDNLDIPESGSIPYVLGTPSWIRIPIPGTRGPSKDGKLLAIEFSPRGRIPRDGSTSTLFFQDIKGKRQLRLDYGYNVKTKTIDYHWNQQRVYEIFKIEDHTPVGYLGKASYNIAKYYKYAGRTFVITGAIMDTISIVTASKPIRRTSQVVLAWTLARTGCQVIGAGGAAAGSIVPGLGTAIGGIAGCVIGGFAGYKGGEYIGGLLYDWAEDTVFTSLPEESK